VPVFTNPHLRVGTAWPFGISSVRLTAMTDAANLDSVAVGANEEEAVVTNTQPKFFSALESFHIARARFRKAMERRENMHSGGLA